MSSIPIILIGKLPLVTDTMTGLLLPEIDVVHVCHTLRAATSEIPSLLREEATIPVSCLGSNMTRSLDDQRVPVIVVIGGEFEDEEVEVLRAVEGAEKVPWLKLDLTALPAEGAMTHPAFPGWASRKIKACFREKGLGVEDKGSKGKLFVY